MRSMPLLETIDVKVRFGGNVALDDVSLTVEPATVTGLIGPNGAGKTTLFNAITGLQSLSGGKVLLNDRDVTRLPPHKRARQGLARTFQRLELFTSLSVRDNVRVAGEIRNRWSIGGSRLDANAEADRIIELVGLGEVASREVGEIPTGQARVVELARALMIQPTLLLLDEPASGQTEDETEAFGHLLRKLASEDGLGICLVEHDMALVMNVCETIHVLEFGRMIASGTAEQVRNDPAVIDAYLGAPESVG
jgi:branched-chain amino acid transport system ATP-binding protein